MGGGGLSVHDKLQNASYLLLVYIVQYISTECMYNPPQDKTLHIPKSSQEQ